MQDSPQPPAAIAACGHTSDVPAQLCAACTNRLRIRLDRMPSLYQALGAWLTPASRRPELGHAPAVEAPLPVRQEVLDLRGPGGIVSILEDWRSAVHDARGFTPPDGAGLAPTRIEAAACAIYANLPWISLTWEQATDLADEIRRLEGRALAVISPPEQTIPIGACPAEDADRAVCGATIRVPAGTTDVYCRRCGTRYPPEAWLNLRRWMDHDLHDAAA